MKRFRKLLGFMLTFILILTAGISTVYAGTSGTDITIHKIQMKSFEGFPKDNPNAARLDIPTWFGAGATELAGVLFNYYKVDGNPTYAAMTDEELASVSEATLAAATGVEKTGSFVTTTTGFTIDKLADGRYIFYEDAKNGNVIASKAVPFVLNLPAAQTDEDGSVVYNEDGTVKYLTLMHIYPKNITEEPIPVKSVRIEDVKEDSAKVGDTVHYLLTTSIPEKIANYNQFDFVDTLEDTLDYAGNFTVKLNTTSMAPGTGDFNFNSGTADYYASEPETTGGGTLTVKFTKHGLTKISAAENAKLMVEYDAKINETAKNIYTDENASGDEITNNFKIMYMNTFSAVGTPGPEKSVTSNDVYVYVGGKKFVKTNDYNIDEESRIQYLQGATFKLYYETVDTEVTWTDELIQMNDATGTNTDKFSGTIASGQPILLKSGANGTFEIKGLQAATIDFDGKYKLVETAAPSGYVKLNVPITFTVTKSIYGETTPLQIKNAQVPKIPQTGGIGSIIFLAAGLIMMGAAVVALKRKEQVKR